MKPIAPGGVTLLDVTESADLLRLSVPRFRFLERCGFIAAMDTPLGPRYREDELADLKTAITPPARAAGKLKPREAARILGVDVRTLWAAARDGVVSRDPQGLYDAGEVHDLNEARAGRKTLRLPGHAG